MRTLTLEISPALGGKTVRTLLRHELLLSAHAIVGLKQQETGICLNGNRVFVTARVTPGDVLTVEIGDRGSSAIPPIDFPIHIVWEDDDLLVIDKPAGLLVHPSTFAPEAPTVAAALATHLDGVFHPVNRLDKGTTGLMVIAKSGYLHDRLRGAMADGGLRRSYLAVAVGTVTPPRGRIELPIARDPDSVIKRRCGAGGLAACTDYASLQVGGGLTLLALTPHTGRTHQLRVHLAALGFPLAGDWLYGTEEVGLIDRPALHSAQLWLTHPITGKELHFTADLPADMARLVAEMSPVCCDRI
ncbi:MAG: RluA family pseudouridine synthase [Oscillospiraceae bacterium]